MPFGNHARSLAFIALAPTLAVIALACVVAELAAVPPAIGTSTSAITFGAATGAIAIGANCIRRLGELSAFVAINIVHVTLLAAVRGPT